MGGLEICERNKAFLKLRSGNSVLVIRDGLDIICWREYLGSTQGGREGPLEGKIMVNNLKNLILNRNESAGSSDVGESVKRTDRLSFTH